MEQNEIMFRKVLDTLPVGIWFTDNQGTIKYGNPAGQNIWQGAHYVELNQETACWGDTDALISPEEWGLSLVIQNKEESHKEEIEIECFDGTHKIISNWAVPILDADKNVKGAVAVNQDITEQVQTERELIAERDFSKSLIETAHTVILVLNPDGTVNSFNPYMEKLSGYSLEEVQGRDWFETFLPNQDWKTIRETFKKAIGDIQTQGNINPIVTKQGHERYIEWYDKTLKEINGKILGLLSIGQDITEKLKMQKELEDMALHDALTGLYNRNILKQKLTDDITSASCYGHDLSVFMLDIDHFKKINDNYVHLEGDHVLRHMADVLNNSMRKDDYVARYGGEEFVVVLPKTSLNQAKEIAEHLRRTITEQNISTNNGKRIKITVSIGVACFSKHAQSLQSIIHNADIAMYSAKKNGRNRVRTA